MGGSGEPLGPNEREVALSTGLVSLANPTRLALLRQLRRPRILSEIRIRAEQVRDGLSPDRPMARQAVKAHLDRLLEAGLLARREGWRGELSVEEYVLNQQRLFAILEDLRGLGELKPVQLVDGDTVTLRGPDERDLPPGPHLVIARGLGEGYAFSLAREESPQGPWIIGRDRTHAIALDYDPFVSAEHARIVLDGARYHVEDLSSSRNGTTHNWRLLSKGARSALAHGDVVGVGKTLLLFRER